jgi:hypothetical protein
VVEPKHYKQHISVAAAQVGLPPSALAETGLDHAQVSKQMGHEKIGFVAGLNIFGAPVDLATPIVEAALQVEDQNDLAVSVFAGLVHLELVDELSTLTL